MPTTTRAQVGVRPVLGLLVTLAVVLRRRGATWPCVTALPSTQERRWA